MRFSQRVLAGATTPIGVIALWPASAREAHSQPFTYAVNPAIRSALDATGRLTVEIVRHRGMDQAQQILGSPTSSSPTDSSQEASDE
jgi:hypothetical protein